MKLPEWSYVAGAALLITWSAAMGGSLATQYEPAPVPSNPAPAAMTCPPDAWETFDSLDMQISVRDGETWRVVCVSVEVESLTGELPPTQFSIESRTKYGVWYVFEWEVLEDA